MSRIAILGATGTVGRTLARQLSVDGVQALLVGRNEQGLQQLSAETGHAYETADFTRSASVRDVLAKATESDGELTGLINCVGSLLLKPTHMTSDEEFREAIEANLFTSFACIRAGGELLRQQGGSIVLFASAAAHFGIPNHDAIAAAKAGIIGLARSAAATYAPFNIRINVISPGLMKTDLTRQLWENEPTAAASSEMHALGRLGTAEHATSLARWLLNPENDWITGQVIGLDGGLSTLEPRRKRR